MNLEYAMRNGELVHISQVEKGMKCKCTCPACGAPLIAKQGKVMAHHFAHQSAECEYGVETMLHIMAKSILASEMKFMFPAVSVDLYTPGDKVVSEPRQIAIDEVLLEKRVSDIVPDVVLKIGGTQVIIEIYVTHKVDEDKRRKISDIGVSTVEIDLSKIERDLTGDALKDILLDSVENKRWVYNRVAEHYKAEWLKICERKQTFTRGYAWHVDMCPIKIRVYHGRPYANVTDDCTGCKYCIAFENRRIDEDDQILLCSGGMRIGSYQELRQYLQRRANQHETEV